MLGIGLAFQVPIGLLALQRTGAINPPYPQGKGARDKGEVRDVRHDPGPA